MCQRKVAVRLAAALIATLALLTQGCAHESRGKQVRADTQAPQRSADTTDTAKAARQPEAREEPLEAAPKTSVTAYYFHRTLRCPTCLSIEKQAREALQAGFASELESGRLTWRPVNIEEPGNAHFEKDFELESSSLVIVETTGDNVTCWKNLPLVWDLVGDPARFRDYVQKEVRTFLRSRR